jgi:hypothetical protein
MSQFTLEKELSNALRMDGPILKGPAMRWQRKQDMTDCNQSVNASLNASCAASKTPMKSSSANKSMAKTPSTGGSGGHKTPKSGGKRIYLLFLVNICYGLTIILHEQVFITCR